MKDLQPENLDTKGIFLIRNCTIWLTGDFDYELEVIKVPPFRYHQYHKFELGEKLIVSLYCPISVNFKELSVKGSSFPMDAFITLEDWRNKKLEELGL